MLRHAHSKKLEFGSSTKKQTSQEWKIFKSFSLSFNLWRVGLRYPMSQNSLKQWNDQLKPSTAQLFPQCKFFCLFLIHALSSFTMTMPHDILCNVSVTYLYAKKSYIPLSHEALTLTFILFTAKIKMAICIFSHVSSSNQIDNSLTMPLACLQLYCLTGDITSSPSFGQGKDIAIRNKCKSHFSDFILVESCKLRSYIKINSNHNY